MGFLTRDDETSTNSFEFLIFLWKTLGGDRKIRIAYDDVPDVMESIYFINNTAKTSVHHIEQQCNRHVTFTPESKLIFIAHFSTRDVASMIFTSKNNDLTPKAALKSKINFKQINVNNPLCQPNSHQSWHNTSFRMCKNTIGLRLASLILNNLCLYRRFFYFSLCRKENSKGVRAYCLNLIY